MFGVALLFAVLTLVVGLLGGLLPSSLNLANHQPRLKAATAVSAGLLLASALLVVIPEGFHTASGGHAHGSGEDLAGPVALVMLEYNDGTITAGTAMSEIRSIVHGDGHGEHSDHEHGEEATFAAVAGKVVVSDPKACTVAVAELPGGQVSSHKMGQGPLKGVPCGATLTVTEGTLVFRGSTGPGAAHKTRRFQSFR